MREIKIMGCMDCAFKHVYRGNWECGFKIGKVIQNSNYHIPDFCPIKNENGVVITLEREDGK